MRSKVPGGNGKSSKIIKYLANGGFRGKNMISIQCNAYVLEEGSFLCRTGKVTLDWMVEKVRFRNKTFFQFDVIPNPKRSSLLLQIREASGDGAEIYFQALPET